MRGKIREVSVPNNQVHFLRSTKIKKLDKNFGPYYDELITEVRTAEARHMDEPSRREQGKTIWIWASVVKGVTLCRIAHSRGHEVPLEVLGPNPTGVDINDK